MFSVDNIVIWKLTNVFDIAQIQNLVWLTEQVTQTLTDLATKLAFNKQLTNDQRTISQRYQGD